MLNSAMSNFDPRPGRVNSVAPGRMPLFGVPATIAVEEGRAVLACGGSGGYRILSSVVHATVNVLDHGLTAADAVSAPRVWCQGEETFVDAACRPLGPRRPGARGHQLVVEELTPGGEPFARVSLVTADDGRRARRRIGPAVERRSRDGGPVRQPEPVLDSATVVGDAATQRRGRPGGPRRADRETSIAPKPRGAPLARLRPAIESGGLGVTRIADLLGREKSQVSRTLKTLADVRARRSRSRHPGLPPGLADLRARQPGRRAAPARPRPARFSAASWTRSRSERSSRCCRAPTR